MLEVVAGNVARGRELLTWVDRLDQPMSPHGLAHAEAARAWLHGVAGEFELAVDAALRGMEAVRGDRTMAGGRARPVVVTAIMLDGMGRSDEALSTLLSLDADMAPRWNRPFVDFATALVCYRRGEWDDALVHIDAGLLAAEEVGFGMAVCWPFAIGTLIAAARGEAASAAAWLRKADGLVTPGSLGAEWMAFATARLELAAGRERRAAAIMAATVDAVVAASAPALLVNCGVDAVRLNLAVDRAAARRGADALAAMLDRTASPVVVALADWAAGLVDQDAQLVAGAADALRVCHRIPEGARADHDAAVMHAAAGDAPDARRLATAAAAVYQGLGADQLRRHLLAELRGHGLDLRPRRSSPRPTSGWASLTDTERAIVALIAEGLSNTDIGERLFVSRRTVESHLVRVYGKLDVRNRAELAARSIQALGR
jgi:DNA-binding CsgD family transcriptional regulator